MTKTEPVSRRRAERRGRRAELIAEVWLRFKGYRIPARRFRTKSGEVDIIARKGNLIVLVEVKARQTPQEALNAVGKTAQYRIEGAGRDWIARQDDHAKLSWRCDVIAICPGRVPVHFEDVW